MIWVMRWQVIKVPVELVTVRWLCYDLLGLASADFLSKLVSFVDYRRPVGIAYWHLFWRRIIHAVVAIDAVCIGKNTRVVWRGPTVQTFSASQHKLHVVRNVLGRIVDIPVVTDWQLFRVRLTEYLNKLILITCLRIQEELLKYGLLDVLGTIAVLDEDLLIDDCIGNHSLIFLKHLVRIIKLNNDFDVHFW